ncbi:Leukotriene A-4 hydrolase, partial [Quaeritorhiza haematococci]
PPVPNKFDDSLAKACDELANKWDSQRSVKDIDSLPFSEKDLENFTTSQKIVFLEKLLAKPPFPHSILEALSKTYSLSTVRNAEIRFRWQWLCLMADYEQVFPEVVKFVTEIGRMKFVRPLYR